MVEGAVESTTKKRETHMLDFELLLDVELLLVQAAELVDLVLVFAAHLDLVATRDLLLLG